MCACVLVDCEGRYGRRRGHTHTHEYTQSLTHTHQPTHSFAFEENLIFNDIKELEPEFLWNSRSQFLCVSLT